MSRPEREPKECRIRRYYQSLYQAWGAQHWWPAETRFEVIVGASLDRLFAEPTRTLRERLLSLNGVGPETADSIILYAGNHPVFVVDTYTRRIVERHNILSSDARYEDVRALFERELAPIAEEK